MENHQEELKAHLMAASEEFRSLVERHAQLKQQLQAIESKPRLTMDDEHQEQKIKKEKLRLKDQMNAMLANYKTEHVA